MAGVRTANPQVDIMRFGLSISASTATKVRRISPVAARAGECPLTETEQRLFSRGGETGLPAPFASFARSHVRLRCVETGHFVDFRARLFRPRAANAVMSEQIEECGVSVSSWRDRHHAKFLR